MKTLRKFAAVQSKIEPSSWNVVEIGRKNQWGEQYVVIPLTTECDAKRIASDYNTQQQHMAFARSQGIGGNGGAQ